MPVKIDFKLSQTAEKREVEFRAEGDFDPLSLAQALQFLNPISPRTELPAPLPETKPEPVETKRQLPETTGPFPFPVPKPTKKAEAKHKSDGPYIAKGQKFGKLVALEDAPTYAGRTRVRCECGVEKTVLNASLRNNMTKSCGGRGCRYVPGYKPKPDHSRIRPESISDDDLKNLVFREE